MKFDLKQKLLKLHRMRDSFDGGAFSPYHRYLECAAELSYRMTHYFISNTK